MKHNEVLTGKIYGAVLLEIFSETSTDIRVWKKIEEKIWEQVFDIRTQTKERILEIINDC
jgi:hypothetical protein